MAIVEYIPAPGELEQLDQARYEAECPPEPPARDICPECGDGSGWYSPRYSCLVEGNCTTCNADWAKE